MVRLRSNVSTTTPNRAERRRSLSESTTSTSSTSSPPLGASPPDSKGTQSKGRARRMNVSSPDDALYNWDEVKELTKMVDMVKIEKAEKLSQCPVCLSLPICDIYQCKRGHLICKDCHGKLTRPISCPSCRVPMVDTPIRNRVAELVSLIMLGGFHI